MAMGALIKLWRSWAEAWAGYSPWRLRLGGFVITTLLLLGSGLAGWLIERLALAKPWAMPLLLIAMASCLAGRSLAQAVRAVLEPLASQPDDLAAARERLGWIVGRDTAGLNQMEILRATAETASENGVDGLFAPLFWLLLGALLWCAGLTEWPGPLALAWGFKASSTLDSMLGYRRGRLRWLGTAGARLDDLLVWLPSRLVALSLGELWAACRDGKADASPNAGVSQAAYAYALNIQLGGLNYYEGEAINKPILNRGGNVVNSDAVLAILRINQWLALQWQLIALILVGAFIGWK